MDHWGRSQRHRQHFIIRCPYLGMDHHTETTVKCTLVGPSAEAVEYSTIAAVTVVVPALLSQYLTLDRFRGENIGARVLSSVYQSMSYL